MPGTSPGTDIYVDIYNPAGLRVGPGPVTTVERWTDDNGLNRVGSFTCTIPATDTRRQFVELRGFLKAYTRRLDGYDLLSVGLVRRERVFSRGKETFVEYSGPSYGDELNYRLVGELELSELQIGRPSMVYWHIPEPEYEEEWNVDLTQTQSALQGGLCNRNFMDRWYFNRQWYGTDPTDPSKRGFDTGNYFYFGHEEKFYEVKIHFTRTYTGNIGSFNGRAATWELQYFDGKNFGWRTVTTFTDSTANGAVTFARTGVINWAADEEVEKSWTKTNHGARTDGGANNLYWMRMHPTANLDDFDLCEVEVFSHVSTLDDLQPIIELAPAGWSLNGTGTTPGTTTGSHLQFSGETVLAALNKVAEQSGEMFRISNRVRQVTWLGSGEDAALDRANITLRSATGPVDVQGATAYIARLEKLEDSNEIVTRLYPFGAGNGPARQTLQVIPFDDPFERSLLAVGVDVYEINYFPEKGAPYIENVSATARWGLIEREVTFNEIGYLYDDAEGKRAADIQLRDAAFNWLRSRSEHIAESYRVEVVGLPIYPYPGQTYDLEYLESAGDGELQVKVTGAFMATRVAQELSAGAPLRVTFELSNDPLRRTFVTGQSRMGRIEQATRYQARAQRITHDSVLADVNAHHSRAWVLIESFDGIDLNSPDESNIAKALYRAGKDLRLWR